MRTCTRAKRPLGKRLAFESLENRLLLSTNISYGNWAGYECKAGAKTISAVSGSWTVPYLKASKFMATTAIWVGIDAGPTIEQIGTYEIADANGGITYHAFYQMLPSKLVYVDNKVSIHPGDSISAGVTYISSGTHAGQFLLTLNNNTMAQSFSIYASVKEGYTASRSTAEWIVERVEKNQVITPLANFGSEKLRSCSVVIGGNKMNIGQTSNYKINMVSGGTMLASTGSLTNSGTSSSFTVTYKASGKSAAASVASTALAAGPAVSDDAALTTLDDGAASVVTSADTTSTGLTFSYAWDQGLATFKLTDLVKDDNADLLAKKTHDATANDSVFASISEGNLLDINVL